jgi:hypothetical protein
MKKLTIVGRGTVGCLAIAHFLKWTDWEITWAYDPTIEPTAVGEGTNLIVPRSLFENSYFTFADVYKFNATAKVGIYKKDWGSIGDEFLHPFPVGQTGIHFNAVSFQQYMFEKISQHPRITLLERSVEPEDVDSDYVMMCTGTPRDFTDYEIIETIPVNACWVSQCPWEHARFQHSLTIARPYGWVFGIPLQNRCSIGYLFNENITDLESVQEDVNSILSDYKLEPSMQRKISFKNYIKKVNFTDRVVYNGNSSFFLEPLEATSTSVADFINKLCIDQWKLGNRNTDSTNYEYHKFLNDIESMICFHYASGSSWDNDFWKHAQSLGESKIEKELARKSDFYQIISQSLDNSFTLDDFVKNPKEIGTWGMPSYRLHLDKLGIADKLSSKIK